MGVLKEIRTSLAKILMPKQVKGDLADYFGMIEGYTPVYKTLEGGIYEMELTRACIHSFATHFSKFEPRVLGEGREAIRIGRMLKTQPNPIQDTVKFMYRVATLLMLYNTVVIVPIESKHGEKISGYYPIPPQGVEIVERHGQLYVKYQWLTGEQMAIELERCGIVTQMQSHDPFFGDSNAPLSGTLELMDTQRQGMIEGIKNGSAVRFMAQLEGVLHQKSLDDERRRFVEANFSSTSGGVLLFDKKYEKVTQVKNDRFVIDAQQQDIIQENVFTYFGTNKAILQNSFNNVQWQAYYEGKLEALAIQLGNVMTNMTFSYRALSFDNRIMFNMDQTQYQTPEQKLQRATQLFDRGMMNANDARALFALPPLEGDEGKKYYIRREYVESAFLDRDTSKDSAWKGNDKNDNFEDSQSEDE